MSESNPTSSKSVFEQIADALGSTAQGRAFLDECGRRARSEETALLLDAVARLERQAGLRRGSDDRGKLLALVGQIEAALRESKLALLGSGESAPDGRSSRPLAGVAAQARETGAAIFQAAELIQETAWAMREAGFDAALCDRLDDQTSAVYAACKRQEFVRHGLSAVERAILRADACIEELQRAISPAPAAPPSGRFGLVVDGDIEFVLSPLREEAPPVK